MSSIQSYLFYRNDWSKLQIRKFLERNNILGMGYLDIKPNYYRYRMYNPIKNRQYRIITINTQPLLKAVIMYPK